MSSSIGIEPDDADRLAAVLRNQDYVLAEAVFDIELHPAIVILARHYCG